jgi:hypothetical protein
VVWVLCSKPPRKIFAICCLKSTRHRLRISTHSHHEQIELPDPQQCRAGQRRRPEQLPGRGVGAARLQTKIRPSLSRRWPITLIAVSAFRMSIGATAIAASREVSITHWIQASSPGRPSHGWSCPRLRASPPERAPTGSPRCQPIRQPHAPERFCLPETSPRESKSDLPSAGINKQFDTGDEIGVIRRQKKGALAISSGSPIRPIGMVDTIRAMASAGCPSITGVSVGPGLTTFERI